MCACQSKIFGTLLSDEKQQIYETLEAKEVCMGVGVSACVGAATTITARAIGHRSQ